MSSARCHFESSSFLLVGNGVAATDVEHVVESAVALNIEAALLVASRFGRADTGWV